MNAMTKTSKRERKIAINKVIYARLKERVLLVRAREYELADEVTYEIELLEEELEAL